MTRKKMGLSLGWFRKEKQRLGLQDESVMFVAVRIRS